MDARTCLGLRAQRWIQQHKFGTFGQIPGQAHCPRKPQALKGKQHPPARIPFTGGQTELCRPWKSMVIVVPALAHCEQRHECHVAPLHCCAPDFVLHRAVVVGEIPD
jgi:hypothetical protein